MRSGHVEDRTRDEVEGAIANGCAGGSDGKVFWLWAGYVLLEVVLVPMLPLFTVKSLFVRSLMN